jgi:hypothetical protein
MNSGLLHRKSRDEIRPNSPENRVQIIGPRYISA